MSEPTREENIAAGMERLEAMAESFDDELIEAAGEAAFADRVRRQPWLLAGVSDGMGLNVTVAAIEAGLIEHGVGVYHEPPTLLKLDDDGEPVSPVHWARYQNALALEVFADERGVDLEVLDADVLLAPQRGLKGDVKGERPEFPEDVREAFEEARRAAPTDDAIFIDSVAFGKWICPREGNDPVEVPNIDFQGRVVSAETKKYHPRGYEETLDTMGRNHGRLLEQFREFGWLGEDALTAFFTWAGGSQNVEVLEGIYGRGSLGDAKIIAERDVVEFRLEHGLELGEHAIVRLPAFLSAALMAIPGGGLFGLVSRRTLEEKGVHRDIPELAARMLRRLFGSEWVRTNPITQIELDANENLYMNEISERVEEAHEVIADYRRDQPEEERDEPIPADETAELLEEYLPWNYQSVLSRFRPDEERNAEREFRVDLRDGPFGDSGNAPVASTAAAALRAVDDLVDRSAVQVARDEFVADEAGSEALDPTRRPAESVRGLARVEELENGAGWRVVRTLYDADGRRLGRGETTLVGESTAIDAPDWVGEPAGSGVGPEQFESQFVEDHVAGRAVGAAGVAEDGIAASGRVDGAVERFQWRIDLRALEGAEGRLTTYARRTETNLDATLLDDAGTPLARLQIAES